MPLPQDHDRFATLAAGIQSIVIALAVIIGGGWTVYSFVTLRSAEKAELEARALRTKVPILSITISIGLDRPLLNSFKGDLSKELLRGVPLTVTLKNVGSGSISFPLSAAAMNVRQVRRLSPDGQTIHGGDLLYNLMPIGAGAGPLEATVLPGADLALHYMFPSKGIGFYVVTFAARASSEASGLMQNTAVISSSGSLANQYPTWSASAFFSTEK